MRRSPFEWIYRVLLVLLPLVFLELGARILYKPQKNLTGDWHFTYHPEKAYQWKASHRGIFGTQEFVTNAEHRVGRIFGKEKKAPRIAVLGDSVSFGFNVPYENSYVALLEARLGVEILNFSVPGYSTFQQYYDLVASEQYCPDLIVWQVQANDLVEPFHFLRRLGGIGIDYHRVPEPSGLHFFFRSKLRSYELLSDLFVQSAVSSYGKEEMRAILERDRLFNARNTLEKPEAPNSQAAWKEFDYWLGKIGALCRQQKSPCLALLSPSSFQHYYQSKELTDGLELLNKKISREGIRVLDPWPLIERELAKERSSGLKDPVKLWNLLFLDDIHPTSRGHELLADFLSKEIAKTLHKPIRICP